MIYQNNKMYEKRKNLRKSWDEDCVFCNIAYAEANRLPEYNRTIIHTADFFVVPSLGQFIEGYVLICPKTHFLNLGVMNSILFNRLLDVKEQIRTLLFEEYGRRTVFFEHGPASHKSRGGSCVDHAHLHALPVDLAAPPSWMSEHLKGGRIDDVSVVVEYAKEGNPYFYLECPNDAMYLYDASFLQCQYGRKVFARVLGILERWDWRRYPYFERMIETGNRLRNRIEKKTSVVSTSN
jgi:diadenosine tetraphosphate (Ap4A) HIT family hydrolase